LHLRNNELASLDNCPILPELTYLNLRETKLENIDQISKLTGLTKLSELIVAGTPLEENSGADLKKEVLILLENLDLKRFNKDEVAEEDVQEAKDLKQERIKEAEEKRKEEEERLKEEQEAPAAEE
jgi:Leucine-rich repeat (LRR) protein